jgi:hypothetical protein
MEIGKEQEPYALEPVRDPVPTWEPAVPAPERVDLPEPVPVEVGA